MYHTFSASFPEGSLGLILGCREGDAAAIVVAVKDKGPAQARGVHEGDVVTKIAGKRCGDYDHVLELMRKTPRPVAIDFEREVLQSASPAAARAAPPPAPAPPVPAPPLNNTKVESPPPALAEDDEDEDVPAKKPAVHGQRSEPEKRGKIAARWEELRQEHLAHQEERLEHVREATRGDLKMRTEGLDLDHVKQKVVFFDTLFAFALKTAVAESKAMSERDRDKARSERERRRRDLKDRAEKDEAESRAPRPNIENVAGHPDELRLAVSPAPPGMKLVYTLVDVSHLEPSEATKPVDQLRLLRRIPAAEDETDDEERRLTSSPERKFLPRMSAKNSLEELAQRTHTWHAYEGPIHLDEPGTYAVLSKVVPVAPESTMQFEAAAGLLEDDDEAPKGYADLTSVFVDAVRTGVIDKGAAYETLGEAMRLWETDDRQKATSLVAAELKKWSAAVRRAEDADDPKKVAEKRAKKKLRKQSRAAAVADLRTAQLDFAPSTPTPKGDGKKNYSKVASAGDSLYSSERSRQALATNLAAMLDFEAFVDACAADDVQPDYSMNESEISSAVYELSKSPPIMWHEDYDGELTFVENTKDCRVCTKCGKAADKLYVDKDFAMCRACALEGAGILVDPGARRMWFSQMIEFYPGREIPLPKSHPLLAQILRVLQTNPGIAVRFEGHVNSTYVLLFFFAFVISRSPGAVSTATGAWRACRRCVKKLRAEPWVSQPHVRTPLNPLS